MAAPRLAPSPKRLFAQSLQSYFTPGESPVTLSGESSAGPLATRPADDLHVALEPRTFEPRDFAGSNLSLPTLALTRTAWRLRTPPGLMSPTTLRRRFENVIPEMSTCTTWPASSTVTAVEAAPPAPEIEKALGPSVPGASTS